MPQLLWGVRCHFRAIFPTFACLKGFGKGFICVRCCNLRLSRLFDFVSEVLDLRFPYFSEDQATLSGRSSSCSEVGDVARSFTILKHYSPSFLGTLRRVGLRPSMPRCVRSCPSACMSMPGGT